MSFNEDDFKSIKNLKDQDVIGVDEIPLDPKSNEFIPIIKDILSQKEWDSFFMGDDGIDGEFSSASMYIDLVNKQFAKNSCTPLDERYNCTDFGNDVNKMFNFLLENAWQTK